MQVRYGKESLKELLTKFQDTYYNNQFTKVTQPRVGLEVSDMPCSWGFLSVLGQKLASCQANSMNLFVRFASLLCYWQRRYSTPEIAFVVSVFRVTSHKADPIAGTL